jgi:hypothetical protein
MRTKQIINVTNATIIVKNALLYQPNVPLVKTKHTSTSKNVKINAFLTTSRIKKITNVILVMIIVKNVKLSQPIVLIVKRQLS